MNELFLKIVNASISASWLVLAVLILRLILKKVPKWVNVLLWGIVAIRLICPYSFESTLSLIPSAETIPLNIELDITPAIDSGIDAINNVVNPIISQTNTPVNGASVNPLQITVAIFENIWIFGVAALLLYTAISYWSLQRKIDTAVLCKDNIFQSESVSYPFVLGIVKPKIYLPFNVNGQEMEYIVAHEQAHIRRKDHWWKPLGFLLLSIHWFNPLMWLSYILLCCDIELACDEKVIKELSNQQRADYTQALVDCSINRHMIAACPLAFGEVGVKERVKSVMNYRKPTFGVIIIGLVICVMVAVCFLTNPITLGDHFVLVDRSSPAGTDKLSYDIQLGSQVMSGAIFVEQWIGGECIRSAPVTVTQYVDTIDVSLCERHEGSTIVGTDIQIETNQYGGSLLTYFAYPENLDIRGWAFSSYELEQKVRLLPGEDVILAAKSFDCGSGVRVYDCETLITKPERFQDADYMLVIRAVFSSDPLGVTNHSVVSSPVQEDIFHLGLNAEIIDIDSDKHILYVKDIDKNASVFGDRCAIDCTRAISKFNLLYVNYDDANDVRSIEFTDFEIGDAVIIGLYDSEKQNAWNNKAIAEQIQLATQ